MLYEHSRALYRDLSPLLATGFSRDPAGRPGELLHAAEAMMRRIGSDWTFLHDPSRRLFRDVRHLFRGDDLVIVLRIVERHVQAALSHAAELAASGITPVVVTCAATNRKGKPCGREPKPGLRYCPSHQHLAQRVTPAFG